MLKPLALLSDLDMVETGPGIGPRVYSTVRGAFAGEKTKSPDNARSILKRNSQYYDTKALRFIWLVIASDGTGSS